MHRARPSSILQRSQISSLLSLLDTFLNEKSRSEDAAWVLLSPYLDTSLQSKDKRGKGRVKPRYWSTQEISKEFLDPEDEKIWMMRTRSALDVWVGRIATLLDLGQSESLLCSIFAPGSIRRRENVNLQLSSDPLALLMCWKTEYGWCPTAHRSKTIPFRFSIFPGHGHLQQAGAE